ncbi:MAG TPA: helix-turn-helix domain-containing protein [Dehalococcoidia bacterium]|jgi:excisionase family DNA binding protein|nr:helix-turn-helix domain-containing protein [Dehalococcoidia bacterium]
MNIDPFPEYMTIEQAAAYLSVKPAQVRKLLREFGLSEFTRAQIGKEVRLKKEHLELLMAGSPAKTAAKRRSRAAG